MTRRSKSSYRRAYLKGLRIKAFNKRSRAAKKGWITRKQRYGPSGKKPKRREITPRPIVTIERLKYKPGKNKGGRMVHIEVERTNGVISRISVNQRSFTTQADFQTLESLLTSAEPDN